MCMLYICDMKELYYRFQWWRYNRLFRKIYFFYMKKNLSANGALVEALIAFEIIAGFKYENLDQFLRGDDE